MIRTGVLAFIATLPLIPDKLFFMKYIKAAFDSLTYTGIGFLDHGGDLAPDHSTEGRRERTVGDHLARRPARGDRPDVRAVAGREPQRTDDRRSARPWLLEDLGGQLQPDDGRARDPWEQPPSSVRKVDPSTLTGERVAQIVASAALAGIIGYLAIVWLLRLVRSGRLWYFSVYLVVLGLGLIAVDQLQGSRPVVRPTQALDRPLWNLARGSGDRTSFDRVIEPVAGPLAPGPRAVLPDSGESVEGNRAAQGLVLERRVGGGRSGAE